jgi:hypothetical protein
MKTIKVTEEIPGNAVVMIMSWKGKIYKEGFKIDKTLFNDLLPRDNPFIQEETLTTESKNLIKSMFKALATAGEYTLMYVEKVGHYDPKFDWKGYKKWKTKKSK